MLLFPKKDVNCKLIYIYISYIYMIYIYIYVKWNIDSHSQLVPIEGCWIANPQGQPVGKRSKKDFVEVVFLEG